MDNQYGDGKSSCVDMTANPGWCQNYGDYSIEAKRACPKSCGVCSTGT